MKQAKLTVIAMMIAMMMIVAACSGNNANNAEVSPSASAETTEGTATKQPDPPKERKKVEVLSWWDFTQSEPLKQLKAKFDELNPDLELEYIQIGSGYADKVLTMIAGGGDMPEVMMLAMDKIPVYADKGAILSLENYVSEDYLSSAYPVVSNALSFDGKPYAVARDITSKVMFLNKKMFDEAGVAYPAADWTWDDFRSISKQLSGDGKWGFYFPKYADGYTSWLMQNEGGLVTQDGQSMLGKPESVEALQFLYDMVHVDKSVPTESQAQQFGSNDVSTFVAGKVAMIAGGLSYSATFDTEKVEYLVRPLPTGKKQLSTSFVNAWVIPKGAEDPDLSWRVLEFLSGKEAQQIALDTGMGLPAVQGVDMTAFLNKHPDNKYFIDALAYSAPFPTPIYGAAFNTEVAKQFDLMWLGQKSVQDAVAEMENRAAAILSGGK